MKREDDQQLWDLLGQAAEPELSPFFARNVVRTVRQRSERFESLRSWWYLRRLVPAAGMAAAVIAAVLAIHHPAIQKPVESAPDVIVKIDPQDYDVVADLDELLVTDENSLWDDDTQTL
jgi:anti-sigma factor RsiW